MLLGSLLGGFRILRYPDYPELALLVSRGALDGRFASCTRTHYAPLLVRYRSPTSRRQRGDHFTVNRVVIGRIGSLGRDRIGYRRRRVTGRETVGQGLVQRLFASRILLVRRTLFGVAPAAYVLRFMGSNLRLPSAVRIHTSPQSSHSPKIAWRKSALRRVCEHARQASIGLRAARYPVISLLLADDPCICGIAVTSRALLRSSRFAHPATSSTGQSNRGLHSRPSGARP